MDDLDRVFADIPAPTWLPQMLERLRYFLTLERDWDTYDADPIRRSDVLYALRVLKQGAQTLVSPWVSPIPTGGIQIDWHGQGLDIEIEIDDGAMVILYEDHTTGDDWEAEGDAALGIMPMVLARLAGRVTFVLDPAV